MRLRNLPIHRPVLSGMPLVMSLVPFVVKIGTPSFRRWVLDCLPSKSLHRVRDMVDLMNNAAQSSLDGKKAALHSGDFDSQEKMETGTDILSILRTCFPLLLAPVLLIWRII